MNLVKPPMPDDQYKGRQEEVKNSIKSSITALVQEHLMNRESEVKTELKQQRPAHIDEATVGARRLLLRQFGRRLPQEQRERMLNNGIRLVGTSPALTTIDPQAFPALPTQTAATTLPQYAPCGTPALGTGRQNKRSASNRSPEDEPNNRFEVLMENETTEPVQEVEPERPSEPALENKRSKTLPVSPRRPNVVVMALSDNDDDDITLLKTTLHASTPPSNPTLVERPTTHTTQSAPDYSMTAAKPPLPRLPMPTKPTAHTTDRAANSDHLQTEAEALDQTINSDPGTTDEGTGETSTGAHRLSLTQTTASRPIIHESNGNKSTWSLRPQLHTTMIVIADSNLKRAVTLPGNWEVHVFPGMKLEHATRMVNQLNNQVTRLKHVVISVGINNRACAYTTNNIELGKLNSALGRGPYAGHFLGVSIPPTLSRSETENLRGINSAASNKFLGRFIAPLPSQQVSVIPTDVTGIHYDDETVKKICDKLTAPFLRKMREGTPQS